jgi:hypothetical protein
VASISLLLEYVGKVMDCLIREQESRRDRIQGTQFDGYVAALPAIHRIATRVLFPTDGGRQEPLKWPVEPKYWDPSFREENLLHRCLWIRDHLSDGSWRAKQLAGEARRFRAEAAAIRETIGRAPDVGHLLRQRAALRQFLAGAVTPDTVRARARAQHELEVVEQKLQAARTAKAPVVAGPTRRVTPMVLWIARDARLPEEGSQAFGLPGDVVILVRSAVEAVGGGKGK